MVKNMRPIEPSEYWTYGWEEAELRQLRRDAACSFRENLIWLEEMNQFAQDFARFRFAKGADFPKIPTKK
jgi:hypothetical protein